LLRGQRIADPCFVEDQATPVAQSDLVDDHDEDRLSAARGILLGVLITSSFWALMVLLWWLV
jgi:hypothetical protein